MNYGEKESLIEKLNTKSYALFLKEDLNVNYKDKLPIIRFRKDSLK